MRYLQLIIGNKDEMCFSDTDMCDHNTYIHNIVTGGRKLPLLQSAVVLYESICNNLSVVAL